MRKYEIGSKVKAYMNCDIREVILIKKYDRENIWLVRPVDASDDYSNFDCNQDTFGPIMKNKSVPVLA